MNGVADELFHGAAEAFELGPQVLPVRVEERTDVLRVEALRARREAHEVREEDRGRSCAPSRRASGVEASGAPQLLQKRESDGFSRPQALQATIG